jgi:hypothetical protein
LAAGISYAPPRITLTEGVLESPSLGMRLAGTINTGGAIALKGALVPSYYGVNRVARHLPVLGRIITGAGGEGFQVFDFEIHGTTVAPASQSTRLPLAPGAMRDLIKLLPHHRVPVGP